MEPAWLGVLCLEIKYSHNRSEIYPQYNWSSSIVVAGATHCSSVSRLAAPDGDRSIPTWSAAAWSSTHLGLRSASGPALFAPIWGQFRKSFYRKWLIHNLAAVSEYCKARLHAVLRLCSAPRIFTRLYGITRVFVKLSGPPLTLHLGIEVCSAADWPRHPTSFDLRLGGHHADKQEFF